ncbi:MAG: DMT family transporter [Gaiellaceae bacterium]
MSGGAGLAVALTLTAGLAGSVQAAVMGELGERVGIVPALAFSTLVAVAGGLVVLSVVERNAGGLRDTFREPAWLWTGGLLSLLIVLAITVATPRIGVTATVGLVIAGNLAMAAVIDHFGLFGQGEVPIGWARLLGLALLAAGSALSLSSS